MPNTTPDTAPDTPTAVDDATAPAEAHDPRLVQG